MGQDGRLVAVGQRDRPGASMPSCAARSAPGTASSSGVRVSKRSPSRISSRSLHADSAVNRPIPSIPKLILFICPLPLAVALVPVVRAVTARCRRHRGPPEARTCRPVPPPAPAGAGSASAAPDSSATINCERVVASLTWSGCPLPEAARLDRGAGRRWPRARAPAVPWRAAGKAAPGGQAVPVRPSPGRNPAGPGDAPSARPDRRSAAARHRAAASARRFAAASSALPPSLPVRRPAGA